MLVFDCPVYFKKIWYKNCLSRDSRFKCVEQSAARMFLLNINVFYTDFCEWIMQLYKAKNLNQIEWHRTHGRFLCDDRMHLNFKMSCITFIIMYLLYKGIQKWWLMNDSESEILFFYLNNFWACLCWIFVVWRIFSYPNKLSSSYRN